MGQLEGLHREISALARKSPNDGLNKFKLKFVNSALANASEFLGNDYKPMDGFEQFDAEERVLDFKIIASHNESLHSHDAIAVITKGVEHGFNKHVSMQI